MTSAASAVPVAGFYRFAPLSDLPALREAWEATGRRLGVRGTLILAPEGVNATLSATTRKDLEIFVEAVAAAAGPLPVCWSGAATPPFRRFKVRIKPEIVTLCAAGVDPARDTGTHVPPAQWDALLQAPDTAVIDTRNAFEVRLGTFSGALDPGMKSFRDFPRWAEAHREQLRGKRIAMFCTGGIRCEKASAWMQRNGFGPVLQLGGGILAYLAERGEGASLWQGECFVFDERVAVGPGLEAGEAKLCRACRMPLTPEEQQRPDFSEGVSCLHCAEARTEADRRRFAERQRQVELAATRGRAPHLR
ncbi:MAG TPA: rhodanese-related sulfurtransferase [Mesorhizobium sp.]|jgi:UPF0176 protein|nr:rhodanese-related sulfurtransferase [Mesorhizobium sp.]